MSYQPFRIGIEDFAVLDFHSDGLPAVQAWRVDSDGFSRKKPADRQRLKRSLAEPLLPAVNSDAELGREIVKGRHRHDEVCLWIQPSRYT